MHVSTGSVGDGVRSRPLGEGLVLPRRARRTSLDDADRDAFAHYAVELLEETAGDVLGVLPAQDVALAEPEEDPRKAAIADHVEALLLQRAEAREAKDWGRADAIRDELNALGVVVTDTANGPEWDLA